MQRFSKLELSEDCPYLLRCSFYFLFFCNADVEVKSVEFFCLLRKFLNNPLLFFCVSRGHRSLIFRSNIQIRASLFD